MGKKTTAKTDSTIFGSMILNEVVLLVITLILLFVVKVNFVNGDEYAIAYSMAGGFGRDVSHLIYATIGPLFGFIETALSVVIPGGRVYVCTLVMLLFLAANNILLTLRYYEAEWYSYVVGWLVYAYMLININYSLVTIMLAGSGLLLAYALGKHGETDRVAIAMIVISLVFAGSLRYPLCAFALLCVLAFAFPYKDRAALKPLIISAVFLILVIGINYGMNMVLCRFSAEGAEYMTWYGYSVGFRDFPDVDYDRYKTLFDSVCYSSNDVDMLNHWCFDDLAVFSSENMSYVLSNIPMNQHYNMSIKRIIRDMIGTPAVWIAFLLFAAAVIASIRKDKKEDLVNIVKAVFIMAPFAIIMVGLSVRQRIYPHVFMPFIVFIIIELILFVQKGNKARYVVAAAAFGLILFWNITGVAELRNAAERSEAYGEYIAAHAGQTFLMDNSVVDCMTESVFPIVSESRYQLYPNLVTMSDFDTASPRDFVKLETAGVANVRRPYLSLLEENVYYIGREDGAQIEYLKTYFAEHFGQYVEAEVVHDFGLDSKVKVYRFK